MMPCPDPRFDDLLAAYALGACPPEEAALVRDHLDGCTVCAATFADLSVAREALLVDVPAQAPSDALKLRIMDGVRAEAELFGAAKPVRERASQPSRFAWLRLPTPALAGAAALLIALAVGISQIGGGSGGPARGSHTVTAHVDAAQAPGASAHLVVDGTRARLVVRGLPDPGRGRVYEVWLRNGDQLPRPTSALFSVSRSGTGQTSVPADVTQIDQVLVTSEPAGGSTKPSRVPVVIADV